MKPTTLLIRGVNWLGDSVMSTPALIRLREALPETRIVLVTPEKLRELWSGHPAVDEVVTFGANESVFRVGRRLRDCRCDTALIFPNSPRSAIECWLARIPRRVGVRRPWRNVFLTEKLAPRADETPMTKRSAEEVRLLLETGIALKHPSVPPKAHHVYQYLHLATALGASAEPCAPRLHVTDGEVAAVCEKFGATMPGQRSRPLMAINPGAEYGPAKRWPAERFVATAAAFHRQMPTDWWVFGGPEERGPAEEMARAIREQIGGDCRVESLAGRTSLLELKASCKAVDLLLTNDSGPMHVAAALGTPLVAVFGSTAPEFTGPGLPGQSGLLLVREPVACAPCFLRECPVDFRCMKGITIEQVLAGIQRLKAKA